MAPHPATHPARTTQKNAREGRLKEKVASIHPQLNRAKGIVLPHCHLRSRARLLKAKGGDLRLPVECRRLLSSQALYGCSTVVLIGFTCPAITVGTVILRALVRVRERALGCFARSPKSPPARRCVMSPTSRPPLCRQLGGAGCSYRTREPLLWVVSVD